jgi:hypothetical protein
MQAPQITYTEENETNCCSIPAVEEWDGAEFSWENKKFIRDYTFNIIHIPLNMGKVIARMWDKIKKSKAETPQNEWMLLSTDPSPWKGEHYASVSKEVDGAENVTLSGNFITKVFEGDYKEAKNWSSEMEDYVRSKGKEMKKLYFFYTLCPKCVQHYGKNYTIAFAQV